MQRIHFYTLLFALFLTPVAKSEILLDNFEDGSDAGWSIEGDSRYWSQYGKSIVNPGCGSDYSLRLTRRSKEGWCGVSIGLGRLTLLRCDAIHLAARNAQDVEGIIIDIHCRDGSRWWYKVPLAAGGEWTRIEATAERFFPIENPGKLSRPDLTKVGVIWLIMDKVRDGSVGPWMVDFDEVSISGAVKDGPRAVVSTRQSEEPPVWRGTKARFGVVDSGGFLQVRPKRTVGSELVAVLKKSGANAELIEPEALRGRLSSAAIDVLVMTGPGFVPGDEVEILSHLKAGRSLWYLSSSPIFSQPMTKREGRWEAVKGWVGPVELKRIFETWEQQKHWLDSSMGDTFTVTKDGRKWFGDLPKKLEATKCQYFAANDSIARACTPPWVEVTPLLTMDYEARNWVQLNDRFTGWVMVEYAHRAGPFAGAKILYCGMANDPRSILSPSNRMFGRVVVKCAEELAEPVKDRWTSIPAASYAGLPELTRKNFFNYPGPIFAPIFFGQFPADDPTYWEDLSLSGFNAVYVEIPFRAQADNRGEIIDWAKADYFVQSAKAHGKRVIFDPYSFEANQWAWAGAQVNSNREFVGKFAGAMAKLAKRYKDEPTVVATFIAPMSITYGGYNVDPSEYGKTAWQGYVRDTLKLSLDQASRRYGKAVARWADLPLPEPRTPGKYHLGALYSDYLDFFCENHWTALRRIIGAIRQADPDMPLLLRGQYLDLGIHMKLAGEFANIAPHCECVETTYDTEAYFRGPASTHGVPIGAENGWPKCRGGPLRMALADYLMGGYAYYLYSFGGPVYTRPGMLDLHCAQKAARAVRQGRYPETSLALLIPDTTLYASEPAAFSVLEGKPHLEFAFERFGFNFRAVSAQFVDLRGVKTLVDDGGNAVLTGKCREKIAEWVRQGGTLIVFPQTGKYDLGGSDQTLEKALGVTFVPGRTCVGAGRVIILPEVPTNNKETFRLERLLAECGAERDIVVTPRVNSACFRTKDKTYLVVCNKSPGYVGSYFHESTLPATEAAMSDLKLTVKPNFGFKAARNVVTEQVYEIRNGTIGVNLPKTTFSVIEFER